MDEESRADFTAWKNSIRGKEEAISKALGKASVHPISHTDEGVPVLTSLKQYVGFLPLYQKIPKSRLLITGRFDVNLMAKKTYFGINVDTK